MIVLLAGSSAIAAPVLLHLLLPLLSSIASLQVDSGQIVVTLLATQLAPLCLGAGVRRLSPKLANRVQRPANLLSAILNLTTLVVVLAVYFPLLAAIRLRGCVGMLALLLASWAAGWLLGGPGADNRRALCAHHLVAQRRRRPGHRDHQFRWHGGRHGGPGLLDVRDCRIRVAGLGVGPGAIGSG